MLHDEVPPTSLAHLASQSPDVLLRMNDSGEYEKNSQIR